MSLSRLKPWPSRPEGPRAGTGRRLVVHVCAQSFERTMNNEATKPCSLTAYAGVRECKWPSAPGEVPEEAFSDGGSTPPASTRWTLHEHLLFQRRLCRQGVAVMSKQKLRVKVLMCLDPRFFIFCTLVRPFIKPLRISNMMSCSQDTLSDFPISCNLAGNRVLAHDTMHLVHCFKKHDSIK